MLQKLRTRTVILCLLALMLAASILFFASKSSPGYPINDWTDANIYLTAGKGMLTGRVMYRDLYDHKGPLVYALHALCALVDGSSFTPVFVLEVLFAAAFLLCAERMAAHSGVGSLSFFAMPLTALLCYTCYSLGGGDSVEELCLPLMGISLCTLLPVFDGTTALKPRTAVLNGIAAGCVFWMKYTLVGLQAGLFVVLLLCSIFAGKWREAAQTFGWLVLGAFLSTLPWLCYFGANNGITDWIRVYFRDNLVGYAGSGMSGGFFVRIKSIVKTFLQWIIENPAASIPFVFAIGWTVLNRRERVLRRIAVLTAAFMAVLFIFIGGTTHFFYYGFALCAFVPLAFPPILARLEALLKGSSAKWVGVILCVVAVALSPVMSYNMHADYGTVFGQKKEETMQYQLAAVIRETKNPTLLNYGFMDAGFYTAAGVAPNVKYYHRCNVQLEEMYSEQDRYVQEGLCDYVVARGKLNEKLVEGYDLVAQADAPGFWYDKVWLYRRKGI